MQSFSRALPDKFIAMRGMARDLTASTAHLAQRELDRARDLSDVLHRRLERGMGRDKRS